MEYSCSKLVNLPPVKQTQMISGFCCTGMLYGLPHPFLVNAYVFCKRQYIIVECKSGCGKTWLLPSLSYPGRIDNISNGVQPYPRNTAPTLTFKPYFERKVKILKKNRMSIDTLKAYKTLTAKETINTSMTVFLPRDSTHHICAIFSINPITAIVIQIYPRIVCVDSVSGL